MNGQEQTTGHVFQDSLDSQKHVRGAPSALGSYGELLPLVVTGLVFYLEFLKPLAQGEAGGWVRLVHRIAALIFIGEPVIYGILQSRRLWMHIREFSFERDDIAWIKNAFGYYVLGRHGVMPPQGRSNTGEKMNGMVMILTWFLFVVTGLTMWFGKGIVSINTFPETGGVPLACDMSSVLMWRPFDLRPFGFIYAGAQKNLGPAGVTIVVIREDLLGQCREDIPSYLRYSIHAEKNSLWNTPPCLAIYMLRNVLQYNKSIGGLRAIEKANRDKAGLLYGCIDKHSGFYRGTLSVPDHPRS